MAGMFQGAHAFNQDISSWNVSNVSHMNGMFTHATSFNQDLSIWNVSNVSNMSEMFKGATAFNKDIYQSWFLLININNNLSENTLISAYIPSHCPDPDPESNNYKPTDYSIHLDVKDYIVYMSTNGMSANQDLPAVSPTGLTSCWAHFMADEATLSTTVLAK